MAFTPTDIKNGAARKLNILGEGQALRAERSSILDDGYNSMHDEFEHDGKVFWSKTSESIPDAYGEHLMNILAYRKATDFSIPLERVQILAQIALESHRRINKLSETHRMGVTEIEYY